MKNRFLIFDIGRSLFKLKIYRVSIASYCPPLSLEKGHRIAEEEAQWMVICELMTQTENADHQETDTFHDHLVEGTLVFWGIWHHIFYLNVPISNFKLLKID